MGDSSRVKVDYTTVQCYDPVNECEISRIRSENLSLNPRFSEKCQGIPVQCCDLDLVNELYVPEDVKENEVPLHIRKSDNGIYEICPPGVYQECLKEQQVGLCAAQKCNDLGYLEPDNYYQVCKALGNLDRTAGEGNIPDCSGRTCRQVVNYKPIGPIGGTSVDSIKSQIASQMHSQCPGYADKVFEEKGYTLGDLFNVFPDQESFFIKGTMIVGAVIILILLINWWLGPADRLTGAGVMEYMKGSSLFDEYFGGL